jgi:hypothetical protein
MLRHCLPTLLFLFSSVFAADITADLAIARQHAGFSHDQIMTWALQQKNYTLGADDIIRMRDAGVPEDIVKTLIDHSLLEPVTRKVDLEAPPTPPLGYDGWWTSARERVVPAGYETYNGHYVLPGYETYNGRYVSAGYETYNGYYARPEYETFNGHWVPTGHETYTGYYDPAAFETCIPCDTCSTHPLYHYHFPDMPAAYVCCGSNNGCSSCGYSCNPDYPYHSLGRFGYDTYPLDSPVSYYGFTEIPAGFETFENCPSCGMICTRERDYIGNGSLYAGYGDMNSANEGGLTYHPLIGRGVISQEWVCHTVCDTIPAEEAYYESSCNHCSHCSH